MTAMTARYSAAQTIDDIRLTLASAETALAKFRRALDDDAVYAFEWAKDAMDAAAYIAVARRSLAYLESPDMALERVVAFWMEEALRGARSPRQSTSEQSNAMDRATTAAYATMLDRYTR